MIGSRRNSTYNINNNMPVQYGEIPVDFTFLQYVVFLQINLSGLSVCLLSMSV